MHSLKTAVLVSYGFCNKRWFEITLKIMLEAKAQISIIVLKSRCQQGHTFSLGSWGKSCSLLLLTSGGETFLGLWPHHPVSASEVTWPSLLSVKSLCLSHYLRIFETAFGALPGNLGQPSHLKSFNLITSVSSSAHNVTSYRFQELGSSSKGGALLSLAHHPGSRSSPRGLQALEHPPHAQLPPTGFCQHHACGRCQTQKNL